MVHRWRSPRWDVLLPVVAGFVSILLVAAAALATYAFRDREALALDGRVLGLAHKAELALRRRGEGVAETILQELHDATSTEVRGLLLLDPEGAAVTHVGATDDRLRRREVVIFVGPQGAPPGSGARRGRRGWRTLVVRLGSEAGAAPLSVRLLPYAAAAVGLGLLALALLGGRLLTRQRREAEVRARNRHLEALGRAGAGLAHQLRTPLATIKGSCQLLEEKLQDKQQIDRVQEAIAQAKRMERMLATLLDFARPPVPEPRSVRLRDVLEEVTKRHGNLQVGDGADLTLQVDPEHLLQIIENLVANAGALDARDGLVEVSATREDQTVQVRVLDRGPGPGEDPEKLFQPYVTGRADGTGLGLPIARALAEAGGGTLHLEARTGGGCVARLALPAARRVA